MFWCCLYIAWSIKSKDRQYNGQKKNDKSTNNDMHTTTQESKDRATEPHYQQGLNSGASEKLAVPAPLVYVSLFS
jgi:hypothetical protein